MGVLLYIKDSVSQNTALYSQATTTTATNSVSIPMPTADTGIKNSAELTNETANLDNTDLDAIDSELSQINTDSSF